MNLTAQKYPALILAGGLGTRLRTVDAVRPKPMVLVEGEPFLYWLIKHLEKAGFNEFIFSTGYKAQFIKDFAWSERFKALAFSFYEETTALGTGGAVKAVFEGFKGLGGAWVINGDTLLTNPLPPDEPSTAVQYAALTGAQIYDAKPNLLTEGNRVLAVKEGGTYFDGGQVFVTRAAALGSAIQPPCSIHQLLADAFASGAVSFSLVEGTCYDIGTPERLARFQAYLRGFDLMS